jgi:hypothetical protein
MITAYGKAIAPALRAPATTVARYGLAKPSP